MRPGDVELDGGVRDVPVAGQVPRRGVRIGYPGDVRRLCEGLERRGHLGSHRRFGDLLLRPDGQRQRVTRLPGEVLVQHRLPRVAPGEVVLRRGPEPRPQRDQRRHPGDPDQHGNPAVPVAPAAYPPEHCHSHLPRALWVPRWVPESTPSSCPPPPRTPRPPTDTSSPAPPTPPPPPPHPAPPRSHPPS